MTGTVTRRPAPMATRGIVEAEVRRVRRRAQDGGTLLLRAAPEWRGEREFEVDGATVEVVPCNSLLAVLDAMTARTSDYLVVLTPADESELGDTLLSRVLRNRLMLINRWDLVRQVFGAKRLDPRLTSDHTWLADALLESQPPGGWPRVKGAMLDYDTALAAVTAARLELCDATDAAGLLEWSQDIGKVARFVTLPPDEQQGISDWLERTTGPVAAVLLRLVRAGHAEDAVAFGLTTDVLFAPTRRQAHIAAQARAERLFDGPLPSGHDLHAYGEACRSLLLRWLQAAQPRADDMLERAQELLAELQVADLAADSRLLKAGYRTRLAAFRQAVADAVPDPGPDEVAAVEEAFTELTAHHLHTVQDETVTARMAARLVRWLASGEGPPGTLREHVDRQVRDGAWVDRAVALVRGADHRPFEALLDAVRVRRDALDRSFAERLASWTTTSAPPEHLVLVETLLERVARPLPGPAAPLIIVVDGMSAAIACGLGEEIGGRWTEIGERPEGRAGALATVPSLTRFSRTSLLCGELTDGGQAEERRGFRDFWGARPSVLFHKADIRDGVSDEVRAAVADRGTVVGVVLNAVDDSLDKGPARSHWRLEDIPGLPTLLEAARQASRPVVLTSDHGHVLDRGEATATERSEAARHRTGTPGEGEVLVSGPRVPTSGGSVVVPWNERIRYNSRKEGYHGGVSLAEMVVPILVFVPSAEHAPEGWETYNPAMNEPVWWNPVPAAAPSPSPRPGRRKPAARAEGNTLFEVDDAAPVVRSGFGGRVVGSELFAEQRGFSRTRIDEEQVAALIDGLVEAGGRLPLTVAAQRAGQLPARMHGYIATVAKLLNVDGYQVLSVTDGGRTVTLHLELLREQFLGGGG